MASFVTMPHKPRASRAWVQSKHGVSEIIVTKPNGETFIIPATPAKVRKPRHRKGKPHKPQATRKHKQAHAVRPQDHKAIELQERMDKLMQEMGSIHLDDN